MKNRKTERVINFTLLTFHVLVLSFSVGSCKPVPTTADDVVSEDNSTKDFEWVSYTIQEGDSLAGIAEKFDVSMQTVIVCNKLRDVRELLTGTELRIPTINGVAHTVERGDSIVQIADKYHVSDEIILKTIRMSGNNLKEGKALFIPGVFTKAWNFQKISAKAKEFYDIGLTYGGDFDEAITYYSEAIRIQPDYINALFQRAYAYGQTSRYNKAITDYTKVLKIIPYQTSALVNRGTMYAYKKNYNKAIADYTEALGINPYLASALYGRGLCFLDSYEDVVHARDHRLRRLRLLYNYLTNAYARKKGNLDRAIADFTEALLIKPDYMDALYWRSVAYRKNGEFAKGDEDREAALLLNPDFVSNRSWD